MDFGKFLDNLDENKGFKRVSGRQLREAAGEDAASIAQGAQWYYVPAKEYGGFRHIVVENAPNSWAVYYLENVGGAGGASKWADMGDNDLIGAQRAGVGVDEARDLQRLASFLNEGKFGDGEDNGIDLSGFAVQRKVDGDFATVLKECVNIVKQG